MMISDEEMRAVNARDVTFESVIKEVATSERPMLVTESDHDSGTAVILMPEDFAMLQAVLRYQLDVNESETVTRLAEMMASLLFIDTGGDLSGIEKTIRGRLQVLAAISSVTELQH